MRPDRSTRAACGTAVLLVCVLTAGCAYVHTSGKASFELSGAGFGEGVPVSATDDGTEVHGRLVSGGGIANRDVYRDVSIRLYDGDGELLCVRRVGDWNVTAGPTNVSLAHPELAQYVVVHSPDFWNEPMTVEYYAYDPDRGFYPEHAADESDLPTSISGGSAPACRAGPGSRRSR